MYNNNYAIESFINYCDDMMIANENWSEYSNKVSEIRDEISYINKKIHDTDDLKQCVRYIEEGIQSLNRLKKELSKISFSTAGNTFFKIWGIICVILGAVGAIGAIITGIFAAGVMGGSIIGNTAVTVLGQVVIGAIWGVVAKYNDVRIKEKTKTSRDITKEITNAIHALEEMKRVMTMIIANGGRTKADMKDYKITNVKNGVGQLIYTGSRSGGRIH